MTDRRRVNAPAGGTATPVFVASANSATSKAVRSRNANDLRNIYLKTGLTPSASGSAYLELAQAVPTKSNQSLSSAPSSLKLTCTVHGPRPLPRSAPFTPHISLSTHVKFAPFATRQRRGYLRDSTERDLAVHVETALRGVIIGDRWPKSGVEVVITVLEGEEDPPAPTGNGNTTSFAGESASPGLMNVLAGCITVASAAIVDAGIDCVDIVSGGVAAIVHNSSRLKGKSPKSSGKGNALQLVLDPDPLEHEEVVASCVVGYLQSRDEITELWIKGSISSQGSLDRGDVTSLVDSAIRAATATRGVIIEAIKESAQLKMEKLMN